MQGQGLPDVLDRIFNAEVVPTCLHSETFDFDSVELVLQSVLVG